MIATLTDYCGLPTVVLPNGVPFTTITADECHQIADTFRAAAQKHDEIARDLASEADRVAARAMNAEYIERERGAA